MEYGLGGCRPDEGGCFGIVGLDEGIDLGDEILGTDERAAADLTLGDEAEPAFDLVEPGGIGWREVDMEPGSLGQPGTGLWMFVGGIVVDHEMDIEIGWHVGVDMTEETQEFLVPMMGLALSEHLAVGDVEGGE